MWFAVLSLNGQKQINIQKKKPKQTEKTQPLTIDDMHFIAIFQQVGFLQTRLSVTNLPCSQKEILKYIFLCYNCYVHIDI